MYSIRQTLKSATDKLKHLQTSHLDAEVILSFVLGKPREYLLAHPEEKVADEAMEKFNDLIEKRSSHVPVAYLVKNKDFYGRDFYIDERAHIPRPATEDLIDFIKEKIPPDFSGLIVDIGAGSGCIAVTLAILYPRSSLIATDISTDALKVAAINKAKHQVEDRIILAQGDLFAPLTKPVDIIVANPPYGWGQGWSDDPEVEHQPKISYDGGKDGLDIIKRLLMDLPNYLNKNGKAFLKFDPRRRGQVEKLIQQKEFSYQIKKDLAGFDRIALLWLS